MSVAAPSSTITPEELSQELLVCAMAGLVPFIVSSPGMGKSSIVREFAKTHNLFMIDIRLGQCTPEDLNGFPMKTPEGRATFTPFDIFPLESDPIPAGYNGFLIFMDEMNAGSKAVQAAAYKLILERMVGTHKLHPATVIIAAGNKATDKAVVNPLSTALQSRLIHYELDVPAVSFYAMALAKGFDSRIIAFLHFAPQRIMDFRPDHHDKTFACPRTWEFLSLLIKNEKDIDTRLMPRIAGTIGSGAALEFITFAREYSKLPKLADIIALPYGTDVPAEASARYACVLMLADSINAKNAKPVLEYLDGFPPEFRVLFMKVAVARDENIRFTIPEFTEFMRKMSRFVTDLAA